MEANFGKLNKRAMKLNSSLSEELSIHYEEEGPTLLDWLLKGAVCHWKAQLCWVKARKTCDLRQSCLFGQQSARPRTCSNQAYTYISVMAAVRALNDDEVFNEMKKMVCIIPSY
jgi:hypothetical protein